MSKTKKPQAGAAGRKQILKQLYEQNVQVASGVRPQAVKPQEFSYKKDLSTFWILISLVLFATVYTAVVVSQWQLPFEKNSLTDISLQNKESEPSQIATADEAIQKTGLSENDTKAPKASEPQAQAVPTGLDKALFTLLETSPAFKQNQTIDRKTDRQKALDQLEGLGSPDVPLSQLFGLGVSTIVIDPGHGGKDPGTRGKSGTLEKDIALSIAKRLRDRLKAKGEYKVIMTREKDEFLSLNQRVSLANEHRADLFISIHVNYFPNDKVNFVETFYFGPTKDKNVEALALRENADSHYNFGEFKQLVSKVSDTMKFEESRELAQSVQDSLFTHARKVNRNIRNHGIRPAPFVVLLGIDAPSILTEVAVINNKQEEQRLKSSVYRDKIAMFLEKGIVNYLNKTITSGSGGGSNGEEKENLAQAKKQHKENSKKPQ